MKTNPDSDSQYLWFERAGLRFAASMDHLQEVLPAPVIRPIPAVEPALTGLMVLREQVIPVFDPASLASSEPARGIASPVVIILGIEGRAVMGLLGEKVGKVVDLRALKPLAAGARLPRAFSGEFSSADFPRVLALDALGLAAATGLAKTHPPATPPDAAKN